MNAASRRVAYLFAVLLSSPMACPAFVMLSSWPVCGLELAQQPRQRLPLADARDVEHIPHDDEVHVVGEPGCARSRGPPLKDHGEATGQDPVHVLVPAAGGRSGWRDPLRVLPQQVDEALAVPVELALGQREHVDDVRSPGQRLRGLRQHGVPGRAGQDEAPRPGIPVQFGFDRVQDLRDVLELVDQDRGTGLTRKPGSTDAAALASGWSRSNTGRSSSLLSAASSVLLPTVRGPVRMTTGSSATRCETTSRRRLGAIR